MFAGIEILLLLTFLPITQCFPSIIRWSLQIISIGLFFIGLLLEKNKKYFLGYLGCILFSFVYVYNVWKFNQSIVTCIFNIMAGFAFVYFGVVYITQKEREDKYPQKIVATIVALVIITSVTTIVGLQRYPLAVRELGRVGSGYSSSGQAFLDLKFKYKLMNIASWSIVYGIVFAVPWFINQYKDKRKAKYIIGLIIVLICLMKAQLTIGILISVLLVFFSIYKPSKKPKDVLLSIIIVLLLLMLIIFGDEILLFVIQLSGNRNLGMLSTKLQDLFYLMQGNQIGDVLARSERYTRSLNHFIEHPILGMSIQGVSEYGLFGNHSDFFDILGYYGSFGLIVLIYMINTYLKDIKRSKSVYSQWDLFVPLVALIILFVLNPVWYSPQVFATAILLPSCAYLENYSIRNNII